MIKPITLTRTLRSKINLHLNKRFVANDAIRAYLKAPIGQVISFTTLLQYIRTHDHLVRITIPANMHYNRFVRDYWLSHPSGSHAECVSLWHKFKKSQSH